MSSKELIRKLWKKRVVRFVLVGIINTLTDTAILNTLVFAVGIKFIIANIMSASISIVLSYFWNHYIVFQREHPMTLRLFLKFILVTGISVIGVQELVIYAIQHIVTLSDITRLTNLHGTHAKLIQVDGAKLIAVAIAMVWNFALYQLVVFKHPAGTQDINEEGVVPY